MPTRNLRLHLHSSSSSSKRLQGRFSNWLPYSRLQPPHRLHMRLQGAHVSHHLLPACRHPELL
jgi:hypothetical protein